MKTRGRPHRTERRAAAAVSCLAGSSPALAGSIATTPRCGAASGSPDAVGRGRCALPIVMAAAGAFPTVTGDCNGRCNRRFRLYRPWQVAHRALLPLTELGSYCCDPAAVRPATPHTPHRRRCDWMGFCRCERGWWGLDCAIYIDTLLGRPAVSSRPSSRRASRRRSREIGSRETRAVPQGPIIYVADLPPLLLFGQVR